MPIVAGDIKAGVELLSAGGGGDAPEATHQVSAIHRAEIGRQCSQSAAIGNEAGKLTGRAGTLRQFGSAHGNCRSRRFIHRRLLAGTNQQRILNAAGAILGVAELAFQLADLSHLVLQIAVLLPHEFVARQLHYILCLIKDEETQAQKQKGGEDGEKDEPASANAQRNHPATGFGCDGYMQTTPCQLISLLCVEPGQQPVQFIQRKVV